MSDEHTPDETQKQLQITMAAAHQLFQKALISTNFQSHPKIKAALAEGEEHSSPPPSLDIDLDASLSSGSTSRPPTVAAVPQSTNSASTDDDALELYLLLVDVGHATHQLLDKENLKQCEQVANQAQRNAAMLAAANATNSASQVVPLVGVVVSALATAAVMLCKAAISRQEKAEALMSALHNLHVWLRDTINVYSPDLAFKEQALSVQQFPYVVKFLHLALVQAREGEKKWPKITEGIGAMLEELKSLALLGTASEVAAVRKHLRSVGQSIITLQKDIRVVRCTN